MMNTKFKDYELIVTTTLKEAEQIINWLSARVYTISPTIKNELENWRYNKNESKND